MLKGLPTSHMWEVHESCRINYCSICEGGLSRCTVCNLLEGALTTDCARISLPMSMVDIVYAGEMDFRIDSWVVEASPHSPTGMRIAANLDYGKFGRRGERC